MGFKDKFKDFASKAGDVAQDLAKNAGEAAQELAKAAQEKAAYLKELQGLKSAIREQEKVISTSKLAIADAVLAADGETITPEVKELCAKVAEAKSMILGLKNQIESLRATAAVKDPEVEKEISKAIAEIDRETALDIEPAEAAASEDTAVEASEDTIEEDTEATEEIEEIEETADAE